MMFRQKELMKNLIGPVIDYCKTNINTMFRTNEPLLYNVCIQSLGELVDSKDAGKEF
eukprot:UN26126